MRLPFVLETDSRDGASDKDARLTNVLSETDEGVSLAVVRPGLSLGATASGAGNGLVVFNDELISVYDATVGAGNPPVSVGTVSGSSFDFAQSPI